MAPPSSRRAIVGLVAMVACVAALLHGERLASGQPIIDEYVIPTVGSMPHGIVAGPDGNLWFAESAGNKIGRMSISGDFKEFNLRAGSGPETIVTGPDGALWFTEQSGNRIGRITTLGETNEFDVTNTPASMPHGITAAFGAIWFSERAANKIGRITTAGVITDEIALPAGFGPEPDLIIPAPDGNLWFGERGSAAMPPGGKLGRITPFGSFLPEIIPPTQPTATTNTYTHGITVGPDGAIWFTEQRADKIGRVTVAGGVPDEFPLPSKGNMPHAIVAGPDGALWFTEQFGNKIGRITADTHVINEFPLPSPGSMPYQMALGPDGALWFTEAFGNRIGRIAPFATGGSFVIGDQDAVVGNSVVFWGAQWSKANHLSGGQAPPSFKGFEDSIALPGCGTTWTSSPGNSAGPPASIPQVMSVIVASGISKSRSTIAGDIHAIALISTHPGYSPNPGNAGTGTVLEVVPCPIFTQTLGTTPAAVFNTDTTFPFGNCLAAEGCFEALGAANLPAFTFNFSLTPAQVAAVSGHAATLTVIAARDIGHRAGEASVDWLVATADGMALGNLFQNTVASCPLGERGTDYPQNLLCGPNFHTDVTATDSLVIPQSIFQAAAADGSIQIVLNPTADVGRLKIFAVTLKVFP